MSRPPRNRTRSFEFAEQRAAANRVPCPSRPKGCGRPEGDTCVGRDGVELTNWPAHLIREKRAAQAAEAAEAAEAEAAPTDTEEAPA